MKKVLKSLSLLSIGVILFTSCEKDFDTPPVKTVSTGGVKTIADVRVMYVPGKSTTITEDISVYGVVTMDESTGNLYKEAYISDATGNLYLRFISASGLYIGDSIRVNLNGAKILKYNQMLQIDSLHPDNSIVKISTQNFKTPEVVTMSSLLSNLDAAQGKFVQINDAFFAEGGKGLSYADGVTQTSGSRFLFSLTSDDIEVRTSGYANFADDTLETGTGPFIGIVAQYNDGLQLLIRDPKELNFSGVSPQLTTFNDNSITSDGWTTQQVTGTTNWITGNQGAAFGDYYASISNYNGTNTPAEVWLISPSLDLSSSTSPALSFKNASNYNGAQLETLISTNYDGISLPSSATWTPVIANLSSGGFEFVSSGTINLLPFISANTYVAFKYTGSNSDGKTWEIDNIIIKK